MKPRHVASLVAFVAFSFASLLYAQHGIDPDQEVPDPFLNALFEIVAIDGEPIGEFPRLTRLRAADTALVFHDLCFPMATGRDGNKLGGGYDPAIFGPRPAIECIGDHSVTTKIASALERATIIITGRSPDTVYLSDGNTLIMTLHLLN